MHPRALPHLAVALGLGLVLLWSVGGTRASARLPVAEPIVVTTAYVERADTLRRNEFPQALFARHNINGGELAAVLQAATGVNWRRVRSGQVFRFRYALHQSHPDRVTMRLGDERILTLRRDSAGAWRGASEPIAWTVELRRVGGVIETSLWEALDVSIPDSVLPPLQRPELLWDLADGVFGWVIDFTRDNYDGDRFMVLYERLTSRQGDVRFGRVLAAKIESRGVEHAAYVMPDPDGRNAYYDAEGRSLKRAFRLYPVPSFKYISSGFSHSRFHPVLKTRRPHLGVDYAASRGTPIVATGDGVISRAGRWGGYGIMVAIRHPKDIETRYAHMRRLAPGVAPGMRVHQGQIIGEVGMSGLANAPHVHYEFLKNGAHVNPGSAARFGQGEPIAPERRTEFEALRAYYDRLLVPPSPSALPASSD
jgi:murein DD-endopeptidase MepM/ murein hydrolase activator NlpD